MEKKKNEEPKLWFDPGFRFILCSRLKYYKIKEQQCLQYGERIKEKESIISNKNKEIEFLKRELQVKKKELSDLRRKDKEREKVNNSLNEATKKLTRELDFSKNQLKGTRSELASLKTRYSNKEKELEILKKGGV